MFKDILYASIMKTNVGTDNGEKTYSCKQCLKWFSLSQHLKTHLRTHNGETPLSCSQCPKSFYYQSNLKMHLITHTRKKPFSCKECIKTFLYAWYQCKNTYWKKTYSCKQCIKWFSLSHHHLVVNARSHFYQSSLRMHLITEDTPKHLWWRETI